MKSSIQWIDGEPWAWLPTAKRVLSERDTTLVWTTPFGLTFRADTALPFAPAICGLNGDIAEVRIRCCLPMGHRTSDVPHIGIYEWLERDRGPLLISNVSWHGSVASSWDGDEADTPGAGAPGCDRERVAGDGH